MKVAIVTGASRGLGRAAARLFVQQGWGVAAAVRNAAALSELAQEVEGAPGALLPLLVDVADAELVDDLVTRTVERFGRLDVLVNNAATDYPASVEDLTHEQWRRVVAVILNGPFYSAGVARKTEMNEQPLSDVKGAVP